MEPTIEPTVSAYSPLFELRAWRRELDRLYLEFADDPHASARIASARREVDEWIRARTSRGATG